MTEQYPGEVLDLGCGSEPDDRATITGDIREIDGVNVQFSLLQDPWPFPDDFASGIIISHVLEHFTKQQVEHALTEAGRVLQPGGWLEVRTPFGVNYRGDIDHEHEWGWKTPENLSVDTRRGWDAEVPFQLADRSVRLWAVPALGFLTPLLQAAVRLTGGGRWSTDVPFTGGELVSQFEVVA